MLKKSSITLKDALLQQANDYLHLEKEYKKQTGKNLLSLNQKPQKISHNDILPTSIVIPAFNVESSVLACLVAIEQSSFNIQFPDKLQVIVVDDGSTDKTWEVIKSVDLSLNLTALHQSNHGQAQALNTGISIAEGDILISCDADMILGYYAIEQLVARHQQIPNALLAGFRQDTPNDDPRVNPKFIRKHGSHKKSLFRNDERVSFSVPGQPSNMCLASDNFKKLGHGRSLLMPDGDAWLLPDLVFGALFSLPRSVFQTIGGYDERFIGWGCTDSYLAAKAIGAGNFIIPVYAASGLHIHHPARLAHKKQQYKKNRKLFFKLLRNTRIDNHPDWLNSAKERILESFTTIQI